MCRLCGGFTCHSEAQAVALDVASRGGSIPTALRLQSPCAATQASAGELSAENAACMYLPTNSAYRANNLFILCSYTAYSHAPLNASFDTFLADKSASP